MLNVTNFQKLKIKNLYGWQNYEINEFSFEVINFRIKVPISFSDISWPINLFIYFWGRGGGGKNNLKVLGLDQIISCSQTVISLEEARIGFVFNSCWLILAFL